MAADGIVSPEAGAAFERAIELDPDDAARPLLFRSRHGPARRAAGRARGLGRPDRGRAGRRAVAARSAPPGRGARRGARARPGRGPAGAARGDRGRPGRRPDRRADARGGGPAGRGARADDPRHGGRPRRAARTAAGRPRGLAHAGPLLGRARRGRKIRRCLCRGGTPRSRTTLAPRSITSARCSRSTPWRRRRRRSSSPSSRRC